MSRFLAACSCAIAIGMAPAAAQPAPPAAAGAPSPKAAPIVPAVPPRPPDGTYVYALQVGGAPVGTGTVVIDGTARGVVVVKESATFTQPQYTATTTMRYDAATLRETGYSADVALPNGVQHTDVMVKPGSMTASASGGGGTVDIAADPSAPLELIGDNLFASSVLVPAILHATGAKAFTLAVLSGGKPVVCTVVSDPLPSRPPSVPASDVNLALDAGGLRMIYWYDPATYVVHDLAIPSQRAEISLSGAQPRQ